MMIDTKNMNCYNLVLGGLHMCRVDMDLRNEKNLDFAIYSLVLSKRSEFSADELAEEVKDYQNIDDNTLQTRINKLLENWVNSEVIQKHWNTYSIVL